MFSLDINFTRKRNVIDYITDTYAYKTHTVTIYDTGFLYKMVSQKQVGT